MIKYDRHDENWRGQIKDTGSVKLQNQGALYDWRANRTMNTISPFIAPGDYWLTVGDGRFGRDGQFLAGKGARVHCSDLSDALLEIAHRDGEIEEYSAQNSESLSFDDNTFDYVLCKESLHHFPRPYLALWEMFRVAKKGVVIIEPRDEQIDRAPLQFGINLVNKIRGLPKHGFEPVGNFVYKTSEHELSKFMLGMHQRHIAFMPLNDHPKGGIASAKARISVFDALHHLGIRSSRLLCAALMKAAPSDNLIDRANGWRFETLPMNPFLQSS